MQIIQKHLQKNSMKQTRKITEKAILKLDVKKERNSKTYETEKVLVILKETNTKVTRKGGKCERLTAEGKWSLEIRKWKLLKIIKKLEGTNKGGNYKTSSNRDN